MSTATMSIATKLGKMVNYREELPPSKSHDHFIKSILRSREKLQKPYIFFQKTYGHQTRQDGDFRD